jgi:hypothetical protein
MTTKKTALEKLRLSELSLVNAGANQHAKVSICKMVEPSVITKYYSSMDGKAVDFNTILSDSKKWKNLHEAQEELYPLFNALQSSITSNFSDTSLSDASRQANIERATNDFLAAVREVVPELEDEINKLFEDFTKAGSSGDINPDGEIMSEAVTKELAEVKKALADTVAELEKAKADMAEMKAMEEKKKKQIEMQKNDETVEVSGQKIAKSVVGEDQFLVFKAVAVELQKARDDAEMAKLEKRASEEYKHIPGTTADIAKMLKALDGMEEPVAKHFEAIMKAVDEKNAMFFKNVGVSKGNVANSAEEQLEKAAEELRKALPTMTKEQAIVKAYEMNPELVKELA